MSLITTSLQLLSALASILSSLSPKHHTTHTTVRFCTPSSLLPWTTGLSSLFPDIISSGGLTRRFPSLCACSLSEPPSARHVVEGLGALDGHHQALCKLSGHGSQLEADGPVWREALYRYVRHCSVDFSLEANVLIKIALYCRLPVADASSSRNSLPRLPIPRRGTTNSSRTSSTRTSHITRWTE